MKVVIKQKRVKAKEILFKKKNLLKNNQRNQRKSKVL